MFKKSLLGGVLLVVTINPAYVIAADQPSASAQTVVTDSDITAKIKARYALSSLLKGLDISVATSNHNVVLSGNLDADMEYERAISLAESVDGVKDINTDNLIVKSSQAPLKDTYITAKVKGVLMKERLFGDKEIEYWPITVETKNGVVYLT